MLVPNWIFRCAQRASRQSEACYVAEGDPSSQGCADNKVVEHGALQLHHAVIVRFGAEKPINAFNDSVDEVRNSRDCTPGQYYKGHRDVDGIAGKNCIPKVFDHG